MCLIRIKVAILEFKGKKGTSYTSDTSSPDSSTLMWVESIRDNRFKQFI